MSGYLPNRLQRAVIRSFAKTVRDSVANFECDVCSFIESAVQTELFKNFENEHTMYCQSPNCIVREFLKYSSPVKEIER